MNPTDLANQATATAQRALELAHQARLAAGAAALLLRAPLLVVITVAAGTAALVRVIG